MTRSQQRYTNEGDLVEELSSPGKNPKQLKEKKGRGEYGEWSRFSFAPLLQRRFFICQNISFWLTFFLLPAKNKKNYVTWKKKYILGIRGGEDLYRLILKIGQIAKYKGDGPFLFCNIA